MFMYMIKTKCQKLNRIKYNSKIVKITFVLVLSMALFIYTYIPSHSGLLNLFSKLIFKNWFKLTSGHSKNLIHLQMVKVCPLILQIRKQRSREIKCRDPDNSKRRFLKIFQSVSEILA